MKYHDPNFEKRKTLSEKRAHFCLKETTTSCKKSCNFLTFAKHIQLLPFVTRIDPPNGSLRRRMFFPGELSRLVGRLALKNAGLGTGGNRRLKMDGPFGKL